MLLNIFSKHQRYCQKYSISRYFSKTNSSKEVKVQVSQGVVVGREECLPNGEPYNCFQGIPYAVPPVGELRFKSPIPLERFENIELDCTALRDPCHQRDRILNKVVGSENCLNLNLYTPAKSSPQPFPVIVWIHGGGFTFGHGQQYLPLSLVSENVIVVSINYRLCVWGFLCLPEAGIWGNAGLKDQRLALQWVNENIANFNGNPKNVTLLGESAGAVSVHLHTFAKHAHKLFHKAIMLSGVANAEWAFQRQSIAKTHNLCKMLGFQSEDPKKMLEFLQCTEKVTPDAILSKSLALLLPDERRRGPPFPLRPVLEDSRSPDAFIATPVLEIMRQIDTRTIPTIMGYNSGEGLSLLRHSIDKIENVEQDLERFVPRNIPLSLDHPELKVLTQKVRDFYFGGHKITQQHLEGLCNLLTDYHFLIDIHYATKMQATYKSEAPLFAYRYDYTGGRDFFKHGFQLQHVNGACHTDELFYLFQTFHDVPESFDENDAQITKRFSAIWSNFVRYGDPTPAGSEIVKELGFSWTPIKRRRAGDYSCALDYFIFDKQCCMQKDPDKERTKFWSEIYNKYPEEDYSVLNETL